MVLGRERWDVEYMAMYEWLKGGKKVRTSEIVYELLMNLQMASGLPLVLPNFKAVDLIAGLHRLIAEDIAKIQNLMKAEEEKEEDESEEDDDVSKEKKVEES